MEAVCQLIELIFTTSLTVVTFNNAIVRGQKLFIQYLLDQQCPFNHYTIVLAAQNNLPHVVSTLLDRQHTDSIQIFTIATKYSAYDVVDMLIERGIDLEAGLEIAIKYKSEIVVDKLLPLIVLKDEYSMIAVRTGSYNIAKKIIRRITIDLFLEAIGLGYYDIVKLLIEKGVSVEDPILLMTAVKLEFYGITELLLTAGADPNLSTNLGSPLSFAARKGNDKLVELLLRHGAVVDNFSLEIAIKNQKKSTVQLLFDKGGKNKNMVFHAVQSKDIDMVKFVVGLGCTQYSQGLNQAVLTGQFEIADLLLSLGANIEICKEYTMGMLINLNNTTAVKYILDRIKTIDYVDRLIDSARSKGFNYMVELLELYRR